LVTSAAGVGLKARSADGVATVGEAVFT
jgi:hypothetical protein